MSLVPQTKLSVVVHTKNAADTLEQALRSVQFAQEIIVVDMHSTDATVEVAKRFTKNIFQHKDVGYADPAREFGLKKATQPWVLVLDADEEVTPELQTVIEQTLTAPQADIYYLPRKNFVFGQWILRTGWWPDYQPRLFKRGAVSWQVGVHRMPDVKGTTFSFPAEEKYALLHHNYTDITHFIEKLNTYTSLQAHERPASAPQDFSAEQLMEIFAGEFAKRALALDGVEDGLHGVSLSLLQALYEATIYLKQWGEKGFQKIPPENVGAILTKVTEIWRYWWADYQVRHTQGLAKIYWQVRRKLKI